VLPDMMHADSNDVKMYIQNLIMRKYEGLLSHKIRGTPLKKRRAMFFKISRL